MAIDEAQKTMNRIFNRHEKQLADFETLPDAEKRYVREKCPSFPISVESSVSTEDESSS